MSEKSPLLDVLISGTNAKINQLMEKKEFSINDLLTSIEEIINQAVKVLPTKEQHIFLKEVAVNSFVYSYNNSCEMQQYKSISHDFEKKCIESFEYWHEDEELNEGRGFIYNQTFHVLRFLKEIGIKTNSGEIIKYTESKIKEFSEERYEYLKPTTKESNFLDNFKYLDEEYDNFDHARNSIFKNELKNILDLSKIEKNTNYYNKAKIYINSLFTQHQSDIISTIQHVTQIADFVEPYRRSQHVSDLERMGLNENMTLEELVAQSENHFRQVFNNYIKKKE